MTHTSWKGVNRAGAPRSESFARSLHRIVVAVAAASGLPSCTGGGASDPVNMGQTAISEADASSDIDAGPPDPCAPVPLNAALFEEAGSTCALFMNLPCGLPPAATVASCSLDPVTCKNACQTDLLYGCGLAAVSCDDGGAPPDASVVVDCVVCANGIGRRPRGLRPWRRAAVAPALGIYFARIAHLEAASVTAFRDLRRSLAELGAPRGLRHAARRAMADEHHHATVTGRLARRFGGRPRRPRVVQTSAPSLRELLAENAVEGCVGEAYGALVALWQAANAGDVDVACAMHRIAGDEARHASLAWRVLRWGAPHVDEATRASLRALVAQALDRLRQDIEQPVDGAIECIAGHPSLPVARALFAELEALVRREMSRVLGDPLAPQSN